MMAIKLIISDFDGCLLDCKDIHYEALNKALASIDEKYFISYEEHISIYDGISTREKLYLLNKLKNFPLESFDEVFNLKQQFTIDMISQMTSINDSLPKTIKSLKDLGYKFFVASNAIRKTIHVGLERLNILNLVDKIYSNEDVLKHKPNAEIYMKCMVYAGVNPDETIIIEDSKVGREAAARSGASVIGINNSQEFSLERILNEINCAKHQNISWVDKELNILIPAAGLGSRFRDEGFVLPKPLINVNGKTMIQTVVDNLNIKANYIFVVQSEHYKKYNLEIILPLLTPNCKIVQTDGLTEGAACTSLLAKDFINNDNRLIIANSDQYLEWDSCGFMYNMISSNVDGGIVSFRDIDPKWSFAKLDNLGFVSEVAEKNPISDIATAGIYYYKSGKEYVKYAEQMIAKNIRVNNEFYICPIFNEFISDNKKIKTYDCKKMWGIGTPKDLQKYLTKGIS